MPPQNQQAPRRNGLNENYARELMELHTLGVDGGYTQQDIIEVARALTGWTLANGCEDGGFRFTPALHDRGEKKVLGQTIRAGGGIDDGEKRARHRRRASVDRAATSRPSSCGASSATAAGRARRQGRRHVHGDQRRPARSRADAGHVAGVLRGRAPQRKGEDAARVRRQRACARPDARCAIRGQLLQRAAAARHGAVHVSAADRI